MKLASKTISIRALVSFAVLGLAVLLAPMSVFAQNQSPEANDDSAVTAMNTAVNVDVVNNDSDPDGTLNLASVEKKSGPTSGTAVYDVDTETFIYTPNPGFFGIDTFTYTVKDNENAESLPATVTIEVVEATAVPFNVIPKKLNMNKKGVVPVTIRGRDEFEVATIEPSSIVIRIDYQGANLAPKRVKVPGHSNRINLKLDAQEIIQEIIDVFGEINKGDEITLYLTGELIGGGAIFGQDMVIITGQPKDQN
jgi:hypothetical protein